MSATSPKYGLAVPLIAAMISSRRAATASASLATSSSRRPARAAALSISWMSAPSCERPEAMPSSAPPARTQASVPLVSTSIFFTPEEAVDSLAAIAAVPMMIASTGMAG